MKKLFSFEIIKKSLSSAWIWWLVFGIVTSINLLAFPTMFEADAEDTSRMMSLFAETGVGGNGVIFTIIFAVMFAHIFITSEIDRGTLAVTLNTPTTRKQILLSKGLVYVALLIGFPLLVGVVGTLSPIMHGMDFDFGVWWTIVALWALYSVMAGGIAFAISCWFNKGRYALSLSAAILAAFFVLSMLSSIENFDFLRFLTLQTLLDMDAALQGNSVIWQMAAMIVISIPLYVVGVIKFLKKDLPL